MRSPTHGKADLAQALANALDGRADDGDYIIGFEVPQYLKDAVEFVVRASTPASGA